MVKQIGGNGDYNCQISIEDVMANNASNQHPDGAIRYFLVSK
jgi:hypothetical protein